MKTSKKTSLVQGGDTFNSGTTGAIIRASFEGASIQISDVLEGLFSILARSRQISVMILALPDTLFHRNLGLKEKHNHIFYGSPSDMMDRMICAARAYNLDTIVDVPLRGKLEPIGVIDKMVEYHWNQGGGYTEASGCKPYILPKIIDTRYLEKVYRQSSRWPYYETIYANLVEPNYFGYPIESPGFEVLDKMNALQLAAAGERINTILAARADAPENPVSWFSRAHSLKKQMSAYKEDSTLSVLEIGCGKRFGLGVILHLMCGCEYTGVDISPLRITPSDNLFFFDFLRNRVKAPGGEKLAIPPDTGFQRTKMGFSFLEEKVKILSPLDASRLPFENQTFDIIFSDAVLEHVGSPKSVVGEMSRVLKPDGIMFHSIDFDDHHPDGSGQRFLQVSKQDWHVSCQQVYINLLRFSEMDQIITACGLGYLDCKKKFQTDRFATDTLHRDYHKYGLEDLKISNVSVVLKKQS